MSESSDTPVVRLRGVRHNNLKNFDLDLPLGRLIVVTGLSGSGKSSLAFDTLFAEGQRRYIETFSPYARQFFDRMDKPQVDRIEGIPPAIAIEQRNAVRTTRSTIGTMTEICDYLKLVWPRLAQLHCRQCGRLVRQDTPQDIWETLGNAGSPKRGSTEAPPENARLRIANTECLITFDLPLSDKLSLEDSLALVAKQGYQRLLVSGEIVRVEEALQHAAFRTPHSAIRIVQDRVRIVPANRARFIEACEQAYHFGKGKLAVWAIHPPSGPLDPLRFSNRLHCAHCDVEYREPTPALFSFNHPIGACPTCRGFGRIIAIDYERVMPDHSRTLAQGVVRPWLSGQSAECQDDLMKFCRLRQVPTDVPFHKMPKRWQDWVINGDPGYGKDRAHEWPRAWYGVKGYFRWLESKAYKMHVRVLLSRYRAYSTCPACQGQRFQPDALLYRAQTGERAVGPAAAGGSSASSTVPGVPSASLTLAEFYALPISEALRVIEVLAARHQAKPSDPLGLVLGEIRSRLGYLVEVGLGYLTIDRPTRSLSGGETERVNLTTCLGTRLVSTLYVLDEPSVGLHPRDTARLVRILEHLRDFGNTVVVVEHEAGVIRAADQVVDLGPGSGEAGGEVVFQGTVEDLIRSRDSLTGQYLGGQRDFLLPPRRPVGPADWVRGPGPFGIPPQGGRAQPGRDSQSDHADAEGDAAGAPPAADVLRDSYAVALGDPPASTGWLKLTGATRHNLKNLTVAIPLNRLVCLTGVSGSGKTTLVREVLLPALEARLQARRANTVSLGEDEGDSEINGTADEPYPGILSPVPQPLTPVITGDETLARVMLVDQSALGKTPRSNPAVYIGAFDDIREVFAQTDLAKQRGLNASAFSFNSSQGQCERCRGAGFEKIEMQFLSDVFIRCPECNGRRYRPHILEVKVRGPWSVVRGKGGARAKTADHGQLTTDQSWSIADLLEATVDDAIRFLEALVDSRRAQCAVGSLKLLQEVGLGYLRLGQPINTLSGGESQRLKLVSHLAEFGGAAAIGNIASGGTPTGASTLEPLRGAPPNRALFLFDEPTTGLHFDDVRVLLRVFQRLVDAGHSVLVIEHNLDVIRCADWVIDLGPEAGAEGGRVVAEGTPETIAACETSHTGRFLRDLLPPARDVEGRSGGRAHLSLKAPPPGFGTTVSHPTGEGRGEGSPAFAVTTRAASSREALAPHIAIHGAREHNLKNLSVTIPRNRFVVITGVSGSGKSTLAFDLLFAEGQRRFLDSMNAYARQFVEQLSRPDVDLITGIPPTVSIEQRNSRGGGKSTVATVTEIHHFLRLLFARLGTQFCPDCQVPVETQTRDQVGRHLQADLKRRGDLLLLAPVVKNRKGFHTDVAAWAAKHGYAEVRADGKIFSTGDRLRLDRFREHNVEIVIGVLEAKSARATRSRQRRGLGTVRTPQQLVDETLKLGRGTLLALDNHGQVSVHSTERACPRCGRSFEPLDPKHFSYNSPQGWCPKCRGFGELFYLPDVERGANADAIEESWFGWQEGQRELCPECHGARLNPLARAVRLAIADAGFQRAGGRGAPTIVTVGAMTVEAAERFFRALKLRGRAAQIARDILPEIRERLKFLAEVGLGYLQLGRGVTTLSGGEGQRIRLAAQLGSTLSGVLYVLDEPTIGLHARDNERLLAALAILKARGNSLVVVEHDEATMRSADHIIDLGPGAGVRGGQVVASGTLAELQRHGDSITGQCLRARKQFPSRGQRRPVAVRAGTGKIETYSALAGRASVPPYLRASAIPPSAPGTPDSALRIPRSVFAGWLTLHHAAVHNLKNLTVRFPLNRLTVVTGVSGSGKSTLLRDCLLPAVQAALASRPRLTRTGGASSPRPAGRERRRDNCHVTGFESLRAVYEVDQSPIGRTPRSIPATYVGFFDEIRRLFSQVPEARMRGYTPSRFSFNSAQGRCPECEGAGTIKLEMSFMPPAFVRCETCQGRRFNPETLDLEFNGRNVAQVLALSVAEALEFFSAVPRLRRPLTALHDTGLDYLKLGQTSPTLSGGEAQRVKLVTHLLAGWKEQLPLFDPRERHNLFVLEEPTIGLHMADVRRLVEVLQRLVDAGHTVVVIEHNLDLIAEADWIIDLGPEGGDAGGRVVAEGTPEQVARTKGSHTGRFLHSFLAQR
ncbi:MAG: excinuclease ABC subunit A [Verrucomicrobia bacterium]|nr:excinuclease ABC subunit A [Verrucomicrobiota bacterium]